MREREGGGEKYSVIVNMATLGNVSHKSTCHTGDSGVRVRFLTRWTKNNDYYFYIISVTAYFIYNHVLNSLIVIYLRVAKGDWDFRISDLVKNPDGTDI